MTTTAPDRQPSTPGDLREDIAYLVFRAVDIGDPSRVAALEVADQIMARLDAAPTTYALPEEPPETVTELWDRDGQVWLRTAPRTWGRADELNDPWWRRWTWLRLLDKRGPLSTVPPERTEVPA